MKILLSNDDGYAAPGIQALAGVLREFAEVLIFAPESNCSGCSNALTLHRPLSVTCVEKDVYYVNGTSADSVHIALTGFLKTPPDLVISGLNQGQNMGDDTLYSGTVAAATEGFLFGIPALAFSQVDKGWHALDAAAEIARDIVCKRESLFAPIMQVAYPYLLNINIPNLPRHQLQSLCFTRLGRRHHAESVAQMTDPFGQKIYWIGPAGASKDAGVGTDFHAVEQGHVSVTPLQIDVTHVKQLAAVSLGAISIA